MENKGGNKVIIVLLIIFILIALGLGGYIVYDKVISNSTTDEQTTADDTETTAKETSIKLDDSKDWVYDSDYESDAKVDSYSTKFDRTCYAKDIIVPFINVDSEYAKTSNKEIKSLYEKIIGFYNQGVEDKITFVDQCNYMNFIYGDTLSVVLKYGIGGTDVINPTYYTYNVNLKTGEKLAYKEVYEMAGLSENNIDEKVENAIARVTKENLKSMDDESINTYSEKSIKDYKDSVNEGTIKYFIAENGKLNIVVNLALPVLQGKVTTILTIE